MVVGKQDVIKIFDESCIVYRKSFLKDDKSVLAYSLTDLS